MVKETPRQKLQKKLQKNGLTLIQANNVILKLTRDPFNIDTFKISESTIKKLYNENKSQFINNLKLIFSKNEQEVIMEIIDSDSNFFKSLYNRFTGYFSDNENEKKNENENVIRENYYIDSDSESESNSNLFFPKSMSYTPRTPFPGTSRTPFPGTSKTPFIGTSRKIFDTDIESDESDIISHKPNIISGALKYKYNRTDKKNKYFNDASKIQELKEDILQNINILDAYKEKSHKYSNIDKLELKNIYDSIEIDINQLEQLISTRYKQNRDFIEIIHNILNNTETKLKELRIKYDNNAKIQRSIERNEKLEQLLNY